MTSISKQYSFDSAHQLNLPTCSVEENQEMFGKCNRLHGHTYTLTVEITGPINLTTGMVLNYFDLDAIVKPYVDEILDHRFLNDVFPKMLTTAENMTQEIWYALYNRGFQGNQDYHLKSITLQETPKTMARFEV